MATGQSTQVQYRRWEWFGEGRMGDGEEARGGQDEAGNLQEGMDLMLNL